MTEIFVIRHVQAEGNLYRHMQGHWDGGVTPLGVRQRDALAERFRRFRYRGEGHGGEGLTIRFFEAGEDAIIQN